MIVDNALYHQGVRVDLGTEDKRLGHARVPCGGGDFHWVGLHDPTDGELALVARTFDLHPLAVEDAGDSHQRPKLEQYGDTLFLVIKTLWYVDDEDAVETGEINMFVGPDFVVTVRHGQGIDLSGSRRDLEQRGRSFQSVRDQYYATVRPMHIEYVEPSKRWADLIIPEGGDNRIALDVLLGQLGRVASGQPALPAAV